MADIQEKDSGKKKGKQKKINTRLDFTPMVDMNMLLITFFMLCTSLSKPQTMEISMPTNDKVSEEEQTKVQASRAITLILATKAKCTTIPANRITGITIPSNAPHTMPTGSAPCCFSATVR